ncbi:MAG: uracil-DNA glycosylase [Candidatus Marinimicrobia bacterium]|nr:uracil-DNA glycosylase [Candidatus Neomarinimicrobiota bacterium]
MREECQWFPVCPMKDFYEKGKLDEKWIHDYCKNHWQDCIRYQKERAGIDHSDQMLPDGSIDKNLI